MFDLGFPELILIAIVAVVVIGPKELPRALATAGRWVGKARRTMAHFRSGLDAMVREAELEEMEKKWAAENERIMREHPDGDAVADILGKTDAQMKPLSADGPDKPAPDQPGLPLDDNGDAKKGESAESEKPS